MSDSQFTLGQHEALIQRLVDGQDKIVDRLGAIERALAEKRGERRMATALWAASSGMLGTFVVFISKAWLAAHTR